MTIAAGSRLGVHTVLGSLGEGRMGQVYRVRDTPDGQRLIVIKNESNSSRLDVVLNWTEELRRLAGR